jgi:hypothetical protein
LVETAVFGSKSSKSLTNKVITLSIHPLQGCYRVLQKLLEKDGDCIKRDTSLFETLSTVYKTIWALQNALLPGAVAILHDVTFIFPLYPRRRI